MGVRHDLICGMQEFAPFLDAVLKEVEVAWRMNLSEGIGRLLCGFNRIMAVATRGGEQ
jgi:hypothetical protein